MYPFLQLGPIALPTKAFLYLLAMWWGATVLEWTAAQRGLPAERVYRTAAIAVVSGFVAARLAFVAQNWPAYAQNWLAIIWPLHEGYWAIVGVLVGVVAVVFALRAYQLPPAAVGDAAVPALASVLALHSLADWLAGPGRGQTAADWFPLAHHPVQGYEIVLAGVVAWMWWRTNGRQPFAGWSAAVAMAGYAFGRLLLTSFRADLWLTSGGWSVAQISYLLLLTAALGWLAYHSPVTEAKQDQLTDKNQL